MGQRRLELDELWIHLADRSLANLEKICMKRNCLICEKFWSLGLDLYHVNK